MILLDTDVVSDVMRATPSRTVLDWFAAQTPDDLYLSAIAEAELRHGIFLLPEGGRKDGLRTALETMLQEDFQGRILPFDSAAARAYAVIAARRRRDGRAISQADCQTAAIAAVCGAVLATRNPHVFAGTGVEVVDPWRWGQGT